LISSEHVVYASGQGPATLYGGERVRNSKRDFPRWGKSSGAHEKQDRTR
jgi:hypothetical protein